ncbi:hypothetical protein OAA46_01005 [bacterium]|nr:hypothetical protein [bacterium]
MLDVKPRTVQTYSGGLRRLVKIGKGVKDPDGVSCMINWSEVYNSFRRQMLDGVDEEDMILSRKRTCNSVLRNAKALISEDAMPYYNSWTMDWAPSLRKLRGFKKVSAHYTLPSEELILSTFKYLENQKCNTKYSMLALALHAGMRRKEIAHCRRDWFDLSGDEFNTIKIVQDKKFDPKGHAGSTVLAPEWAQKIYARADGLDYLFSINLATDKTMDTSFEPLITDLRALGWNRNSPLHECRKLYGAFLATTDSLYKAQKCLRHSSPQITSDSYSDLIISEKVIGCWAA